jgi:hypothetical protein
MPAAFSQPDADDGGGLFGQRGDSLLAALACRGGVRARAEVDVVAAKAGQLRCPESGLGEQNDDRVVAAPGPTRAVWGVDERVELGLVEASAGKPGGVSWTAGRISSAAATSTRNAATATSAAFNWPRRPRSSRRSRPAAIAARIVSAIMVRNRTVRLSIVSGLPTVGGLAGLLREGHDADGQVRAEREDRSGEPGLIAPRRP